MEGNHTNGFVNMSVPEFSSATKPKIYINPNFHQINQNWAELAIVTPNHMQQAATAAHINPLFLNRFVNPKSLPVVQPRIHMNPKFLEQHLLGDYSNYGMPPTTAKLEYLNRMNPAPATSTTNVRPAFSSNIPPTVNDSQSNIIVKSWVKIVRKPPRQSPPITTPSIPSAPPLELKPGTVSHSSRFVHITRTKLIRVPSGSPTTASMSKKENLKPAPVRNNQHGTRGIYKKYKLDRRPLVMPSLANTKRRSFISKYALQRGSPATSSKIDLPVKSVFKQSLEDSGKGKRISKLININGVMYKISPNKLERKTETAAKSPKVPTTTKAYPVINPAAVQPQKRPSKRTITVRGAKFAVGASGRQLIRLSPASPDKIPELVIPDDDDNRRSTTTTATPRRRIYIGGLTYEASPNVKGSSVFECTGHHMTMAYLKNAKQRSMHLLRRNLSKVNTPCAIYQRLGRCMAYERGKCPKVHDRRQVAICRKFLQGECRNDDCLLSHEVSLAKMPVCKFYLDGLCVREKCPYLHKKLNEDAEICEDFLRGFCALAGECKRRHEFICPSYARQGKCSSATCQHCKARKKRNEKVRNGEQSQPNKLKVTISEDGSISKNLYKVKRRSVLGMAGWIQEEESDPPSGQDKDGQDDEETSEGCARYYISTEAPTPIVEPQEAKELDESIEEFDESVEEQNICLPRKRPPLGVLPAFIPL